MTFIKRLIKTFLTKEFITFVIIGACITIVHIIFYAIFNTMMHHSLSNLFAFIIASFFSYLANTFITYKSRIYRSNFIAAIVVYTVKLLLNGVLELGFNEMFLAFSVATAYSNVLIPVMITAVITPLQFLVFNKMYKKVFLLDRAI
jgi:putative flippase GtrA